MLSISAVYQSRSFVQTKIIQAGWRSLYPGAFRAIMGCKAVMEKTFPLTTSWFGEQELLCMSFASLFGRSPCVWSPGVFSMATFVVDQSSSLTSQLELLTLTRSHLSFTHGLFLSTAVCLRACYLSNQFVTEMCLRHGLSCSDHSGPTRFWHFLKKMWVLVAFC